MCSSDLFKKAYIYHLKELEETKEWIKSIQFMTVYSFLERNITLSKKAELKEKTERTIADFNKRLIHDTYENGVTIPAFVDKFTSILSIELPETVRKDIKQGKIAYSGNIHL